MGAIPGGLRYAGWIDGCATEYRENCADLPELAFHEASHFAEIESMCPFWPDLGLHNEWKNRPMLDVTPLLRAQAPKETVKGE